MQARHTLAAAAALMLSATLLAAQTPKTTPSQAKTAPPAATVKTSDASHKSTVAAKMADSTKKPAKHKMRKHKPKG